MVEPDGVPLQAYINDGPGFAVLFICRTCQRSREIPIADVVAGLIARGDGDASTGIRKVGRLTRKPCERCGGRRFETRPAYPSRPRGPDDFPPSPREAQGAPRKGGG